MVQSVSPLRTVYMVVVRRGATEAGRTIGDPTLMKLGSRRLGLVESSSCQRRPLPRRCAASFQRESPGRTVMPGSVAGAEGATRAGGGVGRMWGAGSGETRVRGAAGAGGKKRGRSN